MVDSPKSTKEKSISSQCECPTVEQLEEILHGGQLSCNHVDEVWPSLFLGDMYMSHDRYGLWRLGITHVLNAAHGKMCCKVYSSGSQHSRSQSLCALCCWCKPFCCPGLGLFNDLSQLHISECNPES